MSNSVVTVLTPNGRRQNVKIQPNQTLLQILDEVCAKHSFQAANYDLIHHRRILDLSVMFRFSGLPNNAQLEMAEATKQRTEADVTVMLQLEDGSRQSGEFQPATTVLDIVKKLGGSRSDATDIVMIYMRTEIYGDALGATTLKSLGLTSGRAMMRMIHRQPEQLKIQANVSAPLPPRPAMEVDEQPPPAPVQKLDTITAKPTEPTVVQDTFSGSDLVGRSLRVDSKAEDESKMEVETKSPSPVDRKKIKIDEVTNEESKEKGVLHVLGERNAVIFSMDAMQRADTSDLQDSFFTVSVNDLKVLLRDLKTQTEGLDDAPLLTAKMREMDEASRVLQKLNRYKKTIIRIQFPDRLVLQGQFAPVDTISVVMEFIRPYLQCPDSDFYLFSTPPKQKLSPDSRLVELQCVPTSLMHFGCEDYVSDSYLGAEFTEKLSSPAAVLAEVSKIRGRADGSDESGDDNNGEDGAQSSHMQRKPLPGNFKPSASVAGPSDGAKVPKWFKPSVWWANYKTCRRQYAEFPFVQQHQQRTYMEMETRYMVGGMSRLRF